MSLHHFFNIKLKVYKTSNNFLLIVILVSFFHSCNVVKRVKKDEHLIIDNTIIEDGKKNNDERINNIIIQKTNSGINEFLGIRFPLRLYVYNLARPNIDSILNAKVLSDSSKVKRKTVMLSKKQFDKEMQLRRNFNSWLKRTGEAPVILDKEKTLKTINNLKKYYFSKGWFNNKVDYDIKKIDDKKVAVSYKITKNKPYTGRTRQPCTGCRRLRQGSETRLLEPEIPGHKGLS